ncbi:DUF4230 domain-containing protein [Paraurantiacibacter namhicola]|uniref:DUF4230 domain-containing protein n=1 Tax=Paraurantiacibacter namhicola TaxID=645517 RepID=A0A1C7DBH9_9SPHN|nr:DUF4230 domain-containing protein [Paraurantiacibacter namhicola]ANU08742.1 hypothetical protein A6F65_02461 [Paraurantiacibacter namhicola]
MADNTIEREDRSLRTDPAPHDDRSLARVQGVPWLIVILLLAALAFVTWKAFFEQEEGDPVASAMLAFEKQNQLTVFSSRFEVVAESTNERGVLGVNFLKARQAMIVPATVEYRLDLSNVGRDRMQWDADSETLNVVLPSIKTTVPNLDEKNARLFTEGNFVTGGAAEALIKNNSAVAEKKASNFARNPEMLDMARAAAKDAIRQNLAIPLSVAGYGDVTVNVRFDGERVLE